MHTPGAFSSDPLKTIANVLSGSGSSQIYNSGEADLGGREFYAVKAWGGDASISSTDCNIEGLNGNINLVENGAPEFFRGKQLTVVTGQVRVFFI